MPGHKLNSRFLYDGLISADITEISGADTLLEPSGVLDNLQKRFAALCGADESFILTNGSTCGVIAAILSVCKYGDTIIAARNSHRSFFAGIELCGAKPIYVLPQIIEYGFAGSISPKLIECALAENSNVKAVFITSPTYEGVVSDIVAISCIAKKHGVVLIVDEAHGAHFAFSRYFPKTALELGADIVVQSLHKTLPALTQTAMLHVGQGFDSAVVKRWIHMLQTSSPSYMLMAQVDFMTQILESSARGLFEEYTGNLCRFREQAARLNGIKLIGKEGLEVFDIDLGKLVFYNEGRGVWFEQYLREQGGIQVEVAFRDYLIAMTSVADTVEGFKRLLNGLEKAEREIPHLQNGNGSQSTHVVDKVQLERYIGKVSAVIIAPFPPGIPLVVPGEILTESILSAIAELIKNDTVVSGVTKRNGRYFIETKG